jgi:CheY-like chemotaxis protein
VLLVIESDEGPARAALEAGRSSGFKVLVAARGGAAVAMAREMRPDAILMNVDLPYTDGMALLNHLKQDPNLRHIPVFVIGEETSCQQVLRLGALGFTSAPVGADELTSAVETLSSFTERGVRHLLVVEDNETEQMALNALLGGDGVEVTTAGSSEAAEAALEAGPIDCIVLDLKLPRTSGFALLEKVKGDERFHRIPVIVYTGKQLTRREETRLSKFAESIIVKDARSPERLLEEVTLFLHRAGDQLPEEQRLMLEQLQSSAAVLDGKQVLIVDDDVRNVFALTSVLERHGMAVQFAENGRDGIATLKQHPEVDLVLMDIMMPEMDGYETMAAIRKIPKFKKLPIIALTAKAMKGDREKSVAAGASDYITKPVNVDQLLSLMRVWLYS